MNQILLHMLRAHRALAALARGVLDSAVDAHLGAFVGRVERERALERGVRGDGDGAVGRAHAEFQEGVGGGVHKVELGSAVGGTCEDVEGAALLL